MGVKLKDILIRKEIEINELYNKIFAVDSFNVLYQFLTTIRQRDGTPLIDSKSRVTSHLNGLFYRTIKLMSQGLKLIFVFDGKRPKLKHKENERRKEIKKQAREKLKKAIEEKDIESIRRYSSMTSRLTDDMVKESKELLTALGLPIVNAPYEGEAQASYLVKNKDAYAVISQDYDSLIFGADRLIQNLTISEKRKIARTLAYETVKPCIIDLKENLKNLSINIDQLIVLSIIVGTDFNVGGIKGIGPKKALKLLKKYNKNFDKLFDDVKWNNYFDFSWKDVFNLIKNMPVKKDYKIEWKEVNEEKIKKILVDRHDFSEVRVENALNRLKREKEAGKQKGLSDFLK